MILNLRKKYRIVRRGSQVFEANKVLHLGCVWRIPRGVYESLEIEFDNTLTESDKKLFWFETNNYNSAYGIYFSPNQTNNNIKVRAWTAIRNAEVLATENHMASMLELSIGIIFLSLILNFFF